MSLLTTERNNIFVTSDTHFSEEATRVRSRRPFSDINEMDLAIVENWNSKVQPNDRVFHIGDFGKYEMVSKLNGNITLLAGNHERKDVENGLINEQYLLGLGFDEVYLEAKGLHVVLDGVRIEMIHEPSNATTDNYKLFGHIHKLQMIKRGALNVGVDCHNYTPLSLKEIFEYRDAFKKESRNFNKEVFLAY